MREGAGELLVRDLGGAVDGRSIKGMVLIDGQMHRLAIDHGRRCEHHACHSCLRRGLEHVERATDHHLLALARTLLAAGPAKGRLVKTKSAPAMFARTASR